MVHYTLVILFCADRYTAMRSTLEFRIWSLVCSSRCFLRFGFGFGSGYSGCRAGFPTDSHIGFGICAFGVDVVVLARVLDFSKACIKSICFWTGCDQGWKTSGFFVAQSKRASFVESWISLFAVLGQLEHSQDAHLLATGRSFARKFRAYWNRMTRSAAVSR
jgi:hypothetical protein